MIKSAFINEIGNKITIKIKEQKSVGSNRKTGKEIKFNGVSILIRGPTSESENVITKEEAKQLMDCLKQFLD
jgi:hypothetical protein